MTESSYPLDDYYRVELYDIRKGAIKGGFVAPIYAMIAIKLGVRPDIPEEQMVNLIATSTDPDVQSLNGILRNLLGEVNPPEAYTTDRANRICLFTQQDFNNKAIFFELLCEFVYKYLPDFELVYCKMNLSPEEILFRDEHQVVISKEVYNDHQPSIYYNFDLDDD